jgi:hypothetical protein
VARAFSSAARLRAKSPLFGAVAANFHLAPAAALVLRRAEEQPAAPSALALLYARQISLVLHFELDLNLWQG